VVDGQRRDKQMKRSTLSIRGSKVKVTGRSGGLAEACISLDPLGRVAFLVLFLHYRTHVISFVSSNILEINRGQAH